MRLFTAINFSAETKRALADVQQKLRQCSNGGNFSREDNLHLTLVFLGEVAPARVDYVKRAMDSVAAAPFTLSLQGLGSFKREGGDLWWIGVDGGSALTALQTQLHVSLSAQGFTIEKRQYKPHLTLAREVHLRENAALPQFAPIQVLADKISLMKSERLQGKLVYTEIHHRKMS